VEWNGDSGYLCCHICTAEVLVESGDRVDEKEVKIPKRRVEKEEEGISDRVLTAHWRKPNYGCDVLILFAGFFGVWGFALLPARNRELGWWIGSFLSPFHVSWLWDWMVSNDNDTITMVILPEME
jgi:hypothetical protein